MVSPELIRRYPFFAGLSFEQISGLAEIANEEIVEAGHYFFHEEEPLDNFYLVLEGAAAIIFELPEQDVEHTISDQFMRKLQTKDVVISTVGPGEVFGFSGLISPYESTAGAKAVTPCRVIAFNTQEMLPKFQEDYQFGFMMVQKAAQLLRERLRDIRVESLAYITE